MRSLLAVALMGCIFSCTYGLYFHMGETEKKCFIEEIPDETMVIGRKAFVLELFGS